jgi:HicB family
MDSKKTDTVNLVLRLPKAVHKRLRQQADRHNVSLNTEIVNRLGSHEAVTMPRLRELFEKIVKEAQAAGSQQATDILLALIRRGYSIPPDVAQIAQAVTEGAGGNISDVLRRVLADHRAITQADAPKEPEQR